MNKRIDNSRTFARIISGVLVAALLISIFLPWVYIGIKRNGKSYDLSLILRNSYYDSVSEFVEDVIDTFSFRADNDIRFLVLMEKRLIGNLKDSKLSLAELTESLFEIVCIYAVVMDWDDPGDFAENGGFFFSLLVVAAILYLIVFLILLVKTLRGLLNLIRGDRTSKEKLLRSYLFSLVLVIVTTIAVNYELKDTLKSFLGISLKSLFRLTAIPFFGVLLAAIPELVPIIAERYSLASLERKWNIPDVRPDNESIKKALRGMERKAGWRCECGAFNLFSAGYCQKCGARRPDKPICQACGAVLTGESRYCHLCGISVTKKETKLCRYCGEKLVPRALYCGNCGKRTERTVTPSPSSDPAPCTD